MQGTWRYDLKECFSSDDNGLKPVRASGSRWVPHKLNAGSPHPENPGYVAFHQTLPSSCTITADSHELLAFLCLDFIDPKTVQTTLCCWGQSIHFVCKPSRHFHLHHTLSIFPLSVDPSKSKEKASLSLFICSCLLDSAMQWTISFPAVSLVYELSSSTPWWASSEQILGYLVYGRFSLAIKCQTSLLAFLFPHLPGCWVATSRVNVDYFGRGHGRYLLVWNQPRGSICHWNSFCPHEFAANLRFEFANHPFAMFFFGRTV